MAANTFEYSLRKSNNYIPTINRYRDYDIPIDTLIFVLKVIDPKIELAGYRNYDWAARIYKCLTKTGIHYISNYNLKFYTFPIT